MKLQVIKGPLIAFLSGVGVIVLTIAGFEWYCGTLLSESDFYSTSVRIDDTPTVEYFKKQPPRFGYFAPPPPSVPEDQRFVASISKPEKIIINVYPDDCTNSHLRFWKTCREVRQTESGIFLWDLTYTIDEYRRRVTPGEEAKTASKFLMLIGDSTIFGIGVTDENTLSSSLAKHFPEFRFYNYGRAGQYPGEIMEEARRITDEELPEKEGVALYFLKHYQVIRNIGNLREIGSWANLKPVFSEDESKDIVNRGSFQDVKPWLVWFARLTVKSNILKFLRPGVRPDEADFHLMARIIEETKKTVEKKGVKKFYVVVGPTQMEFPAYMLLREFEKLKIPYISLLNWDPEHFVPGRPFIKYDGHPTALYNQTFGKLFSKVLRERLGETKY